MRKLTLAAAALALFSTAAVAGPAAPAAGRQMVTANPALAARMAEVRAERTAAREGDAAAIRPAAALIRPDQALGQRLSPEQRAAAARRAGRSE